LRLQVADSGSGFDSRPTGRGRIGLASTQALLEHHYGTAQSIEYGRSIYGGACVTISIPFRTEPVDFRMGRQATLS